MRNYADPFLIQEFFYLIALLWILIMLREKSPTNSKPQVITQPSTSHDSSSYSYETSDCNGNYGSDERKEKKKSRSLFILCKQLFTLSHVKDAFVTLFRKRPDNFHHTLWWLLAYTTIVDLPHTYGLMFPLVERLYKWDYEIYMTYVSLFKLLTPIATIVLIPILFK